MHNLESLFTDAHTHSRAPHCGWRVHYLWDLPFRLCTGVQSSPHLKSLNTHRQINNTDCSFLSKWSLIIRASALIDYIMAKLLLTRREALNRCCLIKNCFENGQKEKKNVYKNICISITVYFISILYTAIDV